ncbi:MAG: hypothetical protein O7F73_16570, partial [Gammaproteobacteria bacterium]|nr:hypothetical protein [Gammaproteobacteria bacterium]
VYFATPSNNCQTKPPLLTTGRRKCDQVLDANKVFQLNQQITHGGIPFAGQHVGIREVSGQIRLASFMDLSPTLVVHSSMM